MGKILISFILLLIISIFIPQKTQASTLFSDNFTDSDGTLLTTHDPHYIVIGQIGSDARIQSNKLTGGKPYWYENALNSTTDQCLSFDLTTDLSKQNENWYIFTRVNTQNFTHVEASFNVNSDGSGKIDFGDFDATTGQHREITLHNFPQGFFNNNASYNAKLCVLGSNATVYIDSINYGSHDVLSSIVSGTFGFDMSSGTDNSGDGILDNLLYTTDVTNIPPTLPFIDTFDDPDNTPISSHDTHYVVIGSIGSDATIQSNRLTGGKPYRYENGLDSVTDQCLSFDLITDLSKQNENWYAFVRVNPVGFDHAEATFNVNSDGSGKIDFQDFDHNTGFNNQATLHTFNSGFFNNNTSYNAELCVMGSTATVYINGIDYGSHVVQSTITHGTFAFDMSSGLDNSGDGIMDNLTFNTTHSALNYSPIVSSITTSSNLLQNNSSISTSTTYTDQNTSDSHTASWDWGDGNITDGSVSESNGSGTVNGSHTYTQAGVYTITLTVSDNNNAFGSSIYQYMVVYDPSAGFLTGSGKYTSQAGWYTSNTSASGDFKFGIQAKYTNNTIPTGETKLKFQAGGLDLDSTSYDWLVVSGAKATLKGTATVNGSNGYTFLISAIDGSQTNGPNLIRIQIKNPSNSVIYDTQAGDSDTADPTTQIDSGNIKVH